MNLAHLLAVSGFAAGVAREHLDPVRPLFFLEPSDPSLPITPATPDELVQLRGQDPELRVIYFEECRRSAAERAARDLELERRAAREVDADPDPQDETWGSWMILYRPKGEEKGEEDIRGISEILPVSHSPLSPQAAEAIVREGDKSWQVCFRRYVPRKNARILARYFELVEEGREAARRETERQAAEEVAKEAAEEGAP